MLRRSVAATAAGLGGDGASYARLMRPLTRHWEALSDAILGPLIPPPLWPPRRALALAAFGPLALCSARLLAESLFRGEPARALFAGLAGHAVLPLEAPASASFGLVLGMLGHAVGWPFPEGGAQRLSDAMAAYLRDLGGSIVTDRTIEDLDDLPPARAVLLSLTPRQLLRVLGDRLPQHYQDQLARYRYGPGAFKVDWALSAPIPWLAEGCRRSATIHLGGTLDQIAAGERAAAAGSPPERPYLLLAQHSLFDASRAPAGRHTAWAYCHVPNGSTFDMTEQIEAQIEQAAPGFRDRILARHVSGPVELERWNPNLIGGDVGGGAQDLAQLLARPTLSLRPYRTPLRGVYLCASSTPPGGGVHGMAGFHAAQAVLEDAHGRR
jgi:phytoene dehydrogenase-like protein